MIVRLAVPMLLLATLALTACNKEKRLTNRLEGTWNLDEYTEVVSNSSETTNNAGSITFSEDGTGSVTFTSGSSPTTLEFTWTNTADVVEITVDDDVTPWDVKEQSRKDLTLEAETDESINEVTTMVMSKK